jgi:hypothetical protein
MKTSDIGDLTPLCNKIALLIRQETGQKAAVVVAFTLESDHQTVHWTANTTHSDAVKLLMATAENVKSQIG